MGSFLKNSSGIFALLKAIFLFLVIFLAIVGLNKENNSSTTQSSDPKYVLPFPVGEEYRCSQSFGGSITHHGVFYYSVDFAMPKGSIITAARKGTVVFSQENFYDHDQGTERSNVVVIQHGDGTYARYVHLTHNGALVEVGQTVETGDTVGLSGKSGAITYHLHFDVTKDCSQPECQTIPFTFTNCSPTRYPLKSGV